MATRTTRNRIRWQSASALADLKKAQNHYAQMAGLADNRHPLLNDHLPVIMTTLDLVITSAEALDEAL